MNSRTHPSDLSARALRPLFLITYTLGILFALSLLYYATDSSTQPSTQTLDRTTKSSTFESQPFYQTRAIFVSLAATPTSIERNSFNHRQLAIALFLHGIFTASHCLTLAGIQTLNPKIRIFPLLKTVLLFAIMSMGTGVGFVLSLRDKANDNNDGEATSATIRLLMSKLCWLCYCWIWCSLTYGYFVLLCTTRIRMTAAPTSWRSWLFFVGNYKMIPVVCYGVAGVAGTIGTLASATMGHFCELALLACLMGDGAALQQMFMRMREEEDVDVDVADVVDVRKEE